MHPNIFGHWDSAARIASVVKLAIVTAKPHITAVWEPVVNQTRLFGLTVDELSITAQKLYDEGLRIRNLDA